MLPLAECATVNPANKAGYTWAGPQIFNGFSGSKKYIGTTSDITLTQDDVGSVIIVAGGNTITVPKLQAGSEFEFIVNGPPLGTHNNTASLYFPNNWFYYEGVGFLSGPGSGNQGYTFDISGSLRYIKIVQDSGGNWNCVSDNYLTQGVFGQTTPVTSLSVTNSATLTGITAGSIVSTQPQQGAYKKFVAQAVGYENDTSTAQTISFPKAFVNQPVITTNTTGLSLSVSTTALTINAPDATTTYSGLIIVEGI